MKSKKEVKKQLSHIFTTAFSLCIAIEQVPYTVLASDIAKEALQADENSENGNDTQKESTADDFNNIDSEEIATSGSSIKISNNDGDEVTPEQKLNDEKIADENNNTYEWKLSGESKTLTIDDFNGVGAGEVKATEDGGINISNNGGDHWAICKTNPTNQFRLEADVKLVGENSISAALVFGAKSPTEVSGWGGANFNINNTDDAVRVFRSGDYTKDPKGNIDFTDTLHMAFEVMSDGSYTYILTDKNDNKITQQDKLRDWTVGGYVGLLTFNSEAIFSNVTLLDDNQEYHEVIPDWKLTGTPETLDLSKFSSRSGGEANVTGSFDEKNQKITVSDIDENHFVIYGDLERKTNQFRLEADVELESEDSFCAALLFDVDDKDAPSQGWGAANFDLSRGNDAIRVFRAGGKDYTGRPKGELDFSKPVHMAFEVMSDGSYIYKVSQDDKIVSQYADAGTIENWTNGGYIGLLTFNSTATFSNVTLINDNQVTPSEKKTIDNSEKLFKTNLTDMTLDAGEYTISEDGLNITSDGDAFVESSLNNDSNFVYHTKVKFNDKKGAASLVFRSNNDEDARNAYVANINGENGECRLFAFYKGKAFDIAGCQKVDLNENGEYDLTVTVNGLHMTYAVNDIVVGSTADYTSCGNADNGWGQDNPFESGCFGLLTWNSNVTYQDTYVTELKDSDIPSLKDISVTANGGKLESQPDYFSKGSYVSVIYASKETESVEINPVSDMKCEVTGDKTLKDGVNAYTITVTNTDNGAAQAYRLIICRRFKADNEYYDEDYRDQYHYSTKEGWANDPNGMVYFNGTWHFFYQFYYGDTKWGPMHWMHSTSTDLIHWEDKPIEFYPDEYGTAFSGCAVVDKDNVSGLFEGGNGGIVGFITANGKGQKIITVYSEDGINWKKAPGITLNWMNDPLNNTAFRDPHVFKYQDKWFMIIAGGPLRIYSSDNLIDWKCESIYNTLHTECPALYRLPVEGTDQYKWVLNRGGRAYKIGDFKEVGGKWTFVPDSDYENKDGIMNFGKDYYATMAYSDGDYGDGQKPVITISWMNTWDNYCNNVDDASGNKLFNGTFCLQMEMGVKEVGGKYVLVQKPISQYDALDQASDTTTNTLTSENKTIDLGKVGSSYRIDAHLDKAEKGSVTYAVRTDDINETLITYDYATDNLTIDRSKSGAIATDIFGKKMESTGMGTGVKNEDGSVDLHIYVDRMSVEVFNGDYTVAAAAQIFPTNGVNADGACIKTEGIEKDVKATTTITQMASIWKDNTVNSDWKLNGEAKKLTASDFNGVGAGEVESIDGGIKISNNNGDHWAICKTNPTNQFRLEADVKLSGENSISAALVFGAKSPTEVNGWGGANFNIEDENADNVVRVFRNGDYTKDPKGDLDFTGTLHMALEVMKDGSYTYILSDKDDNKIKQQGTLNDWTTGGYVGLLTFKSEATFSNITLLDDNQEYHEVIPDWKLEGTPETLDLNNFSSRNGGEVNVTGSFEDKSQKMTISNLGGDHFVVYDGLDKKTNQFRLEADVELEDEDSFSAALLFAIANKRTPGQKWGGANFDLGRENDAIRVFHAGSDYSSRPKGELDFSQPVHMALEVMSDGSYIYKVTDHNDNVVAQSAKAGTVKDWTNGGYIGLLTFNSAATFSNVTFLNDSKETPPVEKKKIDNEKGLFRTNLTDITLDAGEYKILEDGLNVISDGDAFVESNISSESLLKSSNNSNFVYHTKVKFNEKKGAASLMFLSNNKENVDKTRNAYIANINGETGDCRLFAFYEDNAFDVADCQKVALNDNGEYDLTVTVNGLHMTYAVNGVVVGSTADYTSSGLVDKQLGQDDPLESGYFGLLTWNSDVTYQDTYATRLEDSDIPNLKDISVTANGGKLESQPDYFSKGSYVSVIYASNETESVEINPTTPDGMKCEVTGDKTLKNGVNAYTITVTNPDKDAAQAYHLIICRRFKADDEYYDEDYRDQYHYSTKEGWANDPNGMVYFNGTWHFFYQFYYGDTKWGPMHWMHSTSTDLIHWEDKPIEFYPDEYGTAFSGCAVVDENNVSGLFEGGNGGIVGFITANGQGQKIITIYSEDGVNWKKVPGITLNWMDDPLNNTAFRDPHVFKYQNKWFMIIAGGPLRIYSSDDLRNWKCESTYPTLHTECPALYRLPVEGTDQYKWVLNRGGRAYKIGDFKEVGGKWTFVPDSDYENKDGVMNFGKDYYATMAYSDGDYGDGQKPVITISWMNTWDNYCNNVDDASGNKLFNGTFCLQMEMGVKEVGGKYFLVQKPISQYDALNQKSNTTTDVLTNENTTIDLGKVGSSYRIDAHLDKAEKGSVTYAVRTDDINETLITYNYATDNLTIDRSKSGAIATDIFGKKMESTGMGTGVKNEDGSVDFHIYVDRMSVEVFNGDYTVAAAAQIFPSNGVNADGAYIKTDGIEKDVKATTTITQMASIWKESEPIDPDDPNKYVKGDVNGDKVITAADASLCHQYVLDNNSIKLTSGQINAMKVTNEDVITSNNAAIILQKVLNSDFTFPIENDIKNNTENNQE